MRAESKTRPQVDGYLTNTIERAATMASSNSHDPVTYMMVQIFCRLLAYACAFVVAWNPDGTTAVVPILEVLFISPIHVALARDWLSTFHAQLDDATYQ